MSLQSLPGFRDFYPEDLAKRRYISEVWRRVARRYGFLEYDAPTLESCALYDKKNSGGEILEQLYRFTDRGGREVTLRPEMTPTLARMVSSRAGQLRKPVKWFSIANFFRYERQQKGRLREFWQFNCDLLGHSESEASAADGEMLALMIDTLREFGLTEQDFVLRLSSRAAWGEFLTGLGWSTEALARQTGEFLAVIDKLERESPEALEEKLAAFGTNLAAVQDFIQRGAETVAFSGVLEELRARGLEAFVQVDLTIVRGLAYYTGLVFEVFDRHHGLRAVAGGGRYDGLLGLLSDGKVNLPAVGMGMGDVVLGLFLEAVPAAKARMEASFAADPATEIYLILADPARRLEALGLIQLLRNEGWRVDFSLGGGKVGKQFQSAEQAGATWAVVVGGEWPKIKLKTLTTRQEEEIPHDALAHRLRNGQDSSLHS
jgi:histidyl-tRNA synthetase